MLKIIKKRVLLWLTALLFSGSMLLAQDVPTGLVAAFKKGNTQELSKFLGEKVELIIQNQTTTANKQSAEATMNTFFDTNKVNGFNVNHEGKRNESSFIIGTLTTSNGNYRVNCFFKRIQDAYLIHQIRIDKTNE